MELAVRIRGEGRVEVAAYGLADAEHLVEKEVGRLWPGARVQVRDVARTEEGGRIVEEFAVAYTLTGTVRVEAGSRSEAPGAAFRHARGLVAGSRYAHTRWELVAVE